MTRDPECCRPDQTARDAAEVMRDRDCGCVPIVDDAGIVVGLVTDRDLAVRAIATGMESTTKLTEVMTTAPSCCLADDDLRDVEQKMAELQVRRIPIVDASGRCLGIISQADIARASANDSAVTEQEIALVVEKISQPPGRGRRTPPEPQIAQKVEPPKRAATERDTSLS
jgi:signal-transduction protein with cAMP-binding, CBS, and nucleotidyltransferase domain